MSPFDSTASPRAAITMGGTLHKEITSITDPLIKMVAASPDELIIASLRQVIVESGPRQAEVLRRCAIPRWFDIDVLAVLRERQDGNERVLDLLRSAQLCARARRRALCLPGCRARYLAEGMAGAAPRRPARDQPAAGRALRRAGEAHHTEHARAASKGPLPTTINATPQRPVEPLGARGALPRAYGRPAGWPGTAPGRPSISWRRHTAWPTPRRCSRWPAMCRSTRPARLWLLYLRARIERAALRLDEASDQIDAISEPGRCSTHC